MSEVADMAALELSWRTRAAMTPRHPNQSNEIILVGPGRPAWTITFMVFKTKLD